MLRVTFVCTTYKQYKEWENMEISISVRGLVEFILRSGDIDRRKSAAADNAMQEGSRIHRMIQKRMGPEYQAEVPLSYLYPTEDYNILIDGRADGIIEELENELYTIDEIKGTYKELNRLKEPVPEHLAQAKCYAFFWASRMHLATIRVRMTYCHMETEEIKYFMYEFTYEEISTWFEEVMQEYKKWADYRFAWDMERQASIKQTNFPFSYRKGQKELVTHVYNTIYHKRKLYMEAPTGVGKTISTVFPAIKAMGEDKCSKIFYLTAKTITRTVAENTFSLLRDNGLSFKTVVLTARDKICFLEEANCNPIDCPYARGHFDRVNEAMYDMLIHEHSFSREVIEEYAEKYRVCPFELCLDMSLFADGVICDYNYVFDPHVYLRRFVADGVKNDYVFLVDEAHNLVDRGREMYSAMLCKEDFLLLKKVVKGIQPEMEKRLERCNKELLKLKRECDGYEILDSIEPFILTLIRLSTTMSKYLEDHLEGVGHQEILEFYFEVSHFLMIYELMDSHYQTYCELREDGSFVLKLFCVNPTKNLKERMDTGRSTILFSATLLPIQYYKKLLGADPEDYEVYAETVFEPEKKGIFIGSDVTSKYTRRSQSEYFNIASYIDKICSQRHGNYMVFFPSHAFLNHVFEVYESAFWKDAHTECIRQTDRMNEEEREAFLNRFMERNEKQDGQNDLLSDTDQDRTLIGFCVMGGIFSEGIDLKNDSLIGAIIVGTGLPQVCNEREILKQYFEEQGENGFCYAYQFPAMNKVEQAAGRVIRTSEDVGVIALLDDRFLQNSYRRLFPRAWGHFKPSTTESISGQVSRFWDAWL